MAFFDRLASRLGYVRPVHPALTALRRFSDELETAAGELRATALRALVLKERVSNLRTEAAAWERRIHVAARMQSGELAIAAAKMAGRCQGELEAARSELLRVLDSEIKQRNTLMQHRKRWFDLMREAERLGLDVSGCMLTIDLTRPNAPAGEASGGDDEREFIGNLLDRARDRARPN